MNIKPKVKLNFEMEMTLNESEVKALDALAGYGIEPFLEVFYAKMGKHYLSPYESGLRTLFSKIRSETPHMISKIDNVKKAVSELRQ